MTRRASALAALAIALLASCSSQQTEPTPTPAVSAAPPVADPARPFDAESILAAMRESRRPGGVPDQLETLAVASAVADELWTIDGEPWAEMTIGGSCGPVRCTLDVAGRHADALGEDVWALEVIPGSGEVAVLDARLASIPPDVVALVDERARRFEPTIDASGLLLTAARWGGPDAPSVFELSYRSGNEEGSCALELRVDVAEGGVETVSATDC